MEDKDIYSWLQQARSAGLSDMQIHDQLKKAGWQDDKISQVLTGGYSQQAENEAIGQIAQEFAPPGTAPVQTKQPPVQQMPQGTPAAPLGELPGIFDLIPRAWEIFSQRIGVFAAIAVITLLAGGILYVGSFFGFFASFTGSFAISSVGSSTFSIATFALPVIIAIVMSIAWTFIGSFSTAGIVTAIQTPKQNLNIGSVLGTAMKLIMPFWWVSVLLWFFVSGGMFLGWVPGIIFAVWFSFGLFLPVTENVRGYQALLRSKEYVRGRWWPVFGRYIGFYAMAAVALMLLNGGVMLVTWIIGSASDTTGLSFLAMILNYVIIGAASAVFMPFALCYNYSLYQSVRAECAGSAIDTRQTNSKGIIATAIIGWVVVPVIVGALIFVAYMGLSNARGKARDATRKSDISQLRTALTLYYDDYSRYPSALNEVAGEYISRLPTDPRSDAPYDYDVSSDGLSFTICASLEEYDTFTESQYCIDESGQTSNGIFDSYPSDFWDTLDRE